MSTREEVPEPEPRRTIEAYRLLFDQCGEMVCILDLEGRLTSVNPAGERLTGYPAADLVGRFAAKLIAPELREQAGRQFRERLRDDAGPDETVLLTWQDTSGLAHEARLSQLARWIVTAERSGRSYALNIPSAVISAGHGDAHFHECLRALALFPAEAIA